MNSSSKNLVESFLNSVSDGNPLHKAMSQATKDLMQRLAESLPKIVIIMGYPASGKTTYAASLVSGGYTRLNLDTIGGKLDRLPKLMEKEIIAGKTRFVLDNTYPTAASRASLLEMADRYEIPVVCLWLQTSIEEAQYNACQRMMEKYGRILSATEIKQSKDPNTYPSAVLFRYRKIFEPPVLHEGFISIEKIPFEREDLGYTGKALLLDYDGTLRETVGGNGKYPINEDQIKILPNRTETLRRYQQQGYRLLGVSNQSGVNSRILSEKKARQLFDYTNKLLGLDIETSFCPHGPAPIVCWCRKPMPGSGVEFIHKYQLDPSQTIMVGDRTTDKTFAKRCGITFVHADEFFGQAEVS